MFTKQMALNMNWEEQYSVNKRIGGEQVAGGAETLTSRPYHPEAAPSQLEKTDPRQCTPFTKWRTYLSNKARARSAGRVVEDST
jgi:hypothetical protein